MSVSFDAPDLLTAMRAYLDACATLEGAVDEAEVLTRADAKAVAGLSLRKHLLAQGWVAPVSQRTST